MGFRRQGRPAGAALAVEGLPGGRCIAAMADLMELFGGPVDLVRLEEAGESLRQRVEAEGRELVA